MSTKIKNINFENRQTLASLLLRRGVVLPPQEEFKFSRINESLKPWQVTGLADGEGAFVSTISETGKGVTGSSVSLEFKVTQKSHSSGILYELQEFFNCVRSKCSNR
jgi:hypothetical protein